MLSNPIYDPYVILTKIYSDGAHLKQAIADTYIEEQYRSRTIKIVYGVLETDGYLDFCIRHYAPKAPKLAVRTILKIGIYMLFFMDKKRYMVTDCAVTLCKKLGKNGVGGFINAFLRKVDKDEVDRAIPQNGIGDAIRFSYPEFAWKKLQKEYGKRAEDIAMAKSSGVSVRFVKNAEIYTEKPCQSTPFSEKYHHYLFPSFVREDGYEKGDYTFQSIGSIAICDVVEPCSKLLDACSAPGGKAVLLSQRCDEVTAFELHEHRVELIKQYCARMGAENVTAYVKDSSVFDEKYVEAFDGVLCDVPCSGYGTVSENPDIKLFRKAEDFSALAEIQKGILQTCSRYVKRGGALYYSTCSLFEEENDRIVGEFIKNNPQFTVETIDSPLVHDKKKCGLQFLPDTAYGAGFYVCKMRRV